MHSNYYGDLLIKLINLVVFDSNAVDLPDSLDYDEFFKFCKWHNMENIAYIALKKSGVSEELLKAFSKHYSFNIYIISKQQIYLKMIKETFKNNNIKYMILKGTELTGLYPTNDMRISTDIDIYVGDKTAVCQPLMKGLGFEIDAFNEENDEHDIYKLSNVYCELHPVLIQGNYEWKEECNSITERLLSADDSEMKMSPEDFYIYNLAHTAKHMKFSGVGIKVFLDLELIIRKYGDIIDWDIVEKRLKNAGLSEFNVCARELCECWFNGGTFTPKMVEMKNYVYSSGFCGTANQMLATEFSQNSKKTNSVFIAKLSKGFEILCLPYKEYAHRYPVLKKHKLLTPFFRVYRVVTALLFKRDTVKKVLSKFDSVDIDYSKSVKEFKSSIGL